VTASASTDTSIVSRVREAVRRGEMSLPPLPQVATRVLDLLKDEERLELRRLQEIIQVDAAMSASILRMANSAAFGGLQPIADLDRALARLGLQQVSSIVVAVTAKAGFRSADPRTARLVEQLWDHALFTALGAKRLAAAHGAPAETAFLAGLLHDVGKLMVLKFVDEAAESTPITPFATDELMAELHAELGHQVLQSWKIPEPICRVALRHHEPETAAEDKLLQVVQAANAISRRAGAHPRPEPELNLLEVPAVERLSLTELDLAVLLVDLEDDFKRVRDLI
jgi:putative nucleotidyltransferase with HDIG domain